MKHLLFVLAAATALTAQAEKPMDPNSCPMHAEHMKAQSAGDQRFAEVQSRGARSMGFDQTKTTHHFRTLADGGAIEVTVNDAADTAALSAIRNHLSQIAKQFAAGDF